MAVDDVEALFSDQALQPLQIGKEIPAGQDHGVDAQFPGLLGEGPFREADHFYGDEGGQTGQQRVYVGFGAAGVAAADQMEYFHCASSENREIQPQGERMPPE